MKKLRLLRIEVETTNCTRDTTCLLSDECIDCTEAAVVYVMTDEPSSVFDVFRVKKVEVIGDGYLMVKR